MTYLQMNDLAVGYNGNVLIHDINVQLEKGKILTLIGPNGAGKSTILKSITRHLSPISGETSLDGTSVSAISMHTFAKKAAVVLTERIKTELMTCAEVVAMGRYPYTGMFGKLTPEDWEIVHRSMERVNAQELADLDFSKLSDGQRQRIMLARAICQQPEVIILDEPTAYLDIRYKAELLDILTGMARQEGITVVMSLHEIDLAMKASDYLLCVKGDTIAAFGTPDQVLAEGSIETLYDMDKGSYDPLFGSVELKKPSGQPKVFVIAGAGTGIPVFRSLQKQGIPFATGILYENDLDYPVAARLASAVVTATAFSVMTQSQFDEAAALLAGCEYVLDSGAPIGEMNRLNAALRDLAEQKGLLRLDVYQAL